MVTTIGPWKRPAGRQMRLETYIGTRVPRSTFRTPTPASINACSKVRLQPSRKATRSGLPQLVRRPPYVEKMGYVRFTKPISIVGQEDYNRRGGGACFPMPFIDQPAPAAMVGMTDSSLVDLKISRSGFHPNHTAPDKDKNKIPNGFNT